MPPSRAILVGRLQIAAAAVLWSTSGLFAKAPWFDGWPPEERGIQLAFWRSAFAALFLVPLIRHPRWHWQLLPMVACFAIMVWSFMTAMVYGSAANAIWLQYLAPAWVTLASVFWLKEPLGQADRRMIAWCVAGVIWILFAETMFAPADLVDTADSVATHRPIFAATMAILSGISFAGVVLCMRSMRGADPAWLITWNHGAAALILLFWVRGSSGQIPVASYFALALFGIFQMSLPYVLFARGLRTTTGPEASVLALIEPILVPVWVFLAWRSHPSYDPPGWWTWIGAAMILTGLTLRYLPGLLVQSRMPRATKWNPQAVSPDSASDVPGPVDE